MYCFQLFVHVWTMKLTPHNKASPFCHHSFSCVCVRVCCSLHSHRLCKKKTHIRIKSVSLLHIYFIIFFLSSFLFTEHPKILHNHFWIIVLFSHHFHFSFQPLLLFKQFSPFRGCRNNTLN